MFTFLFLSACGSSAPTELPILATQSRNTPINNTPTITATSTPNAVQTALIVIEIDRATSTARAAQEAKETQAFWVAVTLDVSTQQAKETQIIKTEIAGTSQADYATRQPQTQTAIVATQIIEQDELKSKRASIWIWNLGGSISGVVALFLMIYALFFGIKYLQRRGEADVSAKSHIKPDEQGRFPLVTENSLHNQKLVNPNLMHRSTLDPKAADDLTNNQALENSQNARRLEMVRSVAASPAINKLAQSLMKPTPPAQPDSAGVQISKPNQPLLSSAYPELPLPHWKLLNQWDGKLLPFGVDEQTSLMRVDTSVRPHLMIVGRSRSGKTLTCIRTEIACLLTQGWNVIVMGKRVDFMPFEDHPNFKLISVDVRKDAQKYIDVLHTLTAQMDVRDQTLSAARASTWERYGAPSTMIVIDDYSGAMMRMPDKQAKEVLNEVSQIAMDGAKFGFNLTIGLQRATWQNIDTNLRSQMARIVYSVESAGDSRVALGDEGAERLPAYRHFLTRITDDASIQRGVGFFLEDPQAEAFWRSRPVQQNEPLDWIDGTVVAEPDSQTPPPLFSSAVDAAYKKADETIAIQNLYLGYLSRNEKPSLRAIEMAVFGKTGGSFSANVKKAIADFEGVGVDEVMETINSHVAAWSATTQGATTTTSPVLSRYSA